MDLTATDLGRFAGGQIEIRFVTGAMVRGGIRSAEIKDPGDPEAELVVTLDWAVRTEDATALPIIWKSAVSPAYRGVVRMYSVSGGEAMISLYSHDTGERGELYPQGMSAFNAADFADLIT